MTTLDERFWSKVKPAEADQCWLWTAAGLTPSSQYYGRFRVGSRMIRAHRYSYELMIAPIPDGLEPDHLCRVHPCVNPYHLELVPGRVNTQRGAAARPRRTHCGKGHDLSVHGVFRNNRVKCGPCVREYDREWHRRRAVPRIVATHCPKQHPYDLLNTYVNPRGERQCRECVNSYKREKRKAARLARLESAA